MEASFIGPLPPPAMLHEYEKLYPGAAKMIFEQFERNSEHIRMMQENKQKADICLAKRGQMFALLIIALVISAIIWLASNGYNALAISAAVLSGLALVVGKFLK